MRPAKRHGALCAITSSMQALMPPPATAIRAIVDRALEEDLGRGDVTTDACVPPNVTGEAELRARESLALVGLPIVDEVYRQVDPRVAVDHKAADGDDLNPGDVAATLSGPAAALLRGERVALNLIQRMSAVATLTRRFVRALPEGSSTRITDTRKTTPGLRALERYAVRCGGGFNHREDLSAGILIKDNHIAAAGSIQEAISRARARAPHSLRIECEVDSHAQLAEAMSAGADVVLLDNFADETISDAVAQVAGRAVIEVSGNMTVERVAKLAAAGADVISVGALTHSAPAVDIGLDWVVDGRRS